MRYPTIHAFLKWVPPAIGGGLLGVAAVWTEAKDWIAQQVVWGWAQMSSPWAAALTFLGVCAYVWAIIWTGQTPAPVPETLPQGANGAAPSMPVPQDEQQKAAKDSVEEKAGARTPPPEPGAPAETEADLGMMPLLPAQTDHRPARTGRQAQTPIAAAPAAAAAPLRLRSLADDVSAFCGKDPVAGAHSITALTAQGPQFLAELLPQTNYSAQHVSRLRKLCAAIGEPAIPILCDLIRTGPWHVKGRAAPCFSAFRGDLKAEAQLFELLETPDFDTRRKAIEAVGYAAYSGIRWELTNLAKYDSLRADRSGIDTYSFEKLYPNVVEALVRCFVTTGDAQELSNLHSFLECCIERNENVDFLVFRAIHDVKPEAADAILTNWLVSTNPQHREYALAALERLRLQRAVPALIKMLLSAGEEGKLRSRAGVALGCTLSRRAALAVRAAIGDPNAGTALDWPLSALYTQLIDWPRDVEGRIGAILARPSQERQLLLCALGWRRRSEFRDDIEAGLLDPQPEIRGTSALALAHLLGEQVVEALSDNLAEATSPLERMFTAAALAHAGNAASADDLHAAMQDYDGLPTLFPVWKREIVTGFVVAEGRSERAMLWAELCEEPLDRAIADFERKQSNFPVAG